MKSFLISRKNKGAALIEVVIATALISIITIALVSVTQQSLQLSDRSLKQAQASFLLEEGAEAVKTIRDDSWAAITSVALDTDQYLSFNTGTNKWSLSSTPSTIDNIFTRTVVVSEAFRDGSGDLADSGTADSSTRKVVVTVSWTASSGSLSKSLSFYVLDLFN